MRRVSVEKQSGLGRIVFDDGKVNAIQDEFLTQLDTALDVCERDPDIRAVTVEGREGTFSAGMDLKLLPTLPDAELRGTLVHLSRSICRLFTYPKPVVAAVTGHAIAGGTLLAMCADQRIVAEGPFKLGLSEVQIGIALPHFVVEIASAIVPPPHLVPVVLHGRLLDPADALRMGLADELRPPGEVQNRAVEVARSLGELPPPAYAETKKRLRGAKAAAGMAQLEEELDQFFGNFRSLVRR